MPHRSSRKPSPTTMSHLINIPESPEAHKAIFLERERVHNAVLTRRDERVRKFVDPFENFFVRKWLLFESTFALSMLEPWEKVLVLSLCFFLFSLITIGVCRYLPYHIQFLARRASFYILGDESAHVRQLATLLGAKRH
ncbi:hypothetical protein DACRYDRAFT_117881 [Dacryopinax primogenitus]|uniref:Uncharacterized protein n=1 Tax=Dacryopinax primogenitus (strain DJM 731) TaxID=1858805 RepID=M5FRF6_DACPD|nr:uncharacterized protein DACRYDRAFT_117881 [Dacryopinax primogenitus]EJT99695.1 hypothetical protein DACRYDRAFT_117881 [Dacryopinax primogenitus]